MARVSAFAAGLALGLAIGTAIVVSHADDVQAEVLEAAAAAHVDPIKLQGAVNSTGLDPFTYLRGVGEWDSPPSTPPRSLPASPPAAPAASARGSIWDTLAGCESSGDWTANTGNGYRGGLQFDVATWHDFGGVGVPNMASRVEQIAVAERLHAARGFQPWPACSRRLGLR